MSNNQPDKSGERKRNTAGGISSWHYASQPELKERIINKPSDVNKIGIQYVNSPNQKDATILIRYFHGFLLKYVDLLAHGSISKEGKKVSPNTKQFLALLRTGGNDKPNKMSNTEMQLIASRIPNAFISMTPDDIYNEMVIIFLELARKYNPEIGTFLGYITGHFKYSLKQKMFKVQKDALNYLPLYEEDIEDNESIELLDDEDSFIKETGYSQSSSNLLEAVGLEELNHSFVSSPPEHLGKFLTRLQRKIIVLYFCEGLNFSQISKQLNFGSASNAKVEYDKALKILQEIADIDTLEGA